MFYSLLLVKVAGVLVILLAMAALIAGSGLAWWAATVIGENFQVDFCSGYCLFSLPRLEVLLQVRGNCFCSVGSTSTHPQGFLPVDRLGLCRDQGVGCYVVSTAVQVGNIIPVKHIS